MQAPGMGCPQLFGWLRKSGTNNITNENDSFYHFDVSYAFSKYSIATQPSLKHQELAASASNI
jgi:hypothetical protein